MSAKATAWSPRIRDDATSAPPLAPARTLKPAAKILERTIHFSSPLMLEGGGLLKKVSVGLRLVGPAGAPVVASLGGISAHRRAVSLPQEAAAGWWQKVLGGERLGLTERYRVLGFDWLGGVGATTGPRHWKTRARDFPAVSTRDQARVLARVLDGLGIRRLDAILGASYGGMVAQHFAADHPRRVRRIMILACAHRPDAMAVARRFVQKQILALAGDDSAAGVALARALAMTTYRSAEEFRHRFGGTNGRVELEAYLRHQGDKFARQFDAEAYRRLMDSIDGHTVDPGTVTQPLDLLGFTSDELCPPDLLTEFADAAVNVRRFRMIDSPFGHDAFLCEADAVARAINDFLTGDTP